MSIAKLEHEITAHDGAITSSVHGLLREDARSRREFFTLTRGT